jgi:hypothetical protein
MFWRGEQKRGKENTSMMKNLVGNTMSGILEVIMWLNLVAGSVSGCIIVGMVGKNYYGVVDDRYFIAGGILGILVGFLINVLGGGIFLLLMEIRNYAKETRDYVKEIAEKR